MRRRTNTMKRLSVILLFFLLLVSPVAAKDTYGYTEEHPLIIACDWDFRPFEFLDSDGEPAGYNVEVLGIILDRLEIPHKFVMQEWQAASDMFVNHKADLMHALSSYYNDPSYIQTKKYVNYYTVRAVRRIDTPPFGGITRLTKGMRLGVKKNDYGALRVSELDTIVFDCQYYSPKDGLMRVRNKQCDYYIWGMIPVAHKIQELRIDSLSLDEVSDIPAGELHIIGYNMDVIDAIDDQYTRMEQSGDLQRIYDKWFYPERHHDNESPMAPFLIIGLFLAGVAAFVSSRLITLRVRAVVRRSAELNSMMQQALEMDEYYVLEYDVVSGHVKNLHGLLLPDWGITIEELIERISPEQRDEFRQHVESMKRGECEAWTLQRKWNAGTIDAPDWREYDGSAILERVNGVPRYIVHTVKDITREVEDEQHNQAMANTYKMVYDTNMMALSTYDGDGHLLTFNQRMRELCELNEEREKFFREASLFDDVFGKAFLEQGFDGDFHFCGRMHYPEVGIDKYIESRIVPVKDDEGRLLYFIVSARDVTAEREMYMKQREHDRQLQKTHAAINGYERQLRYLLEESNMYVWSLNIANNQIRFTRSLRQTEYSVTLKDYLDGLVEDEVAAADVILKEYIANGKPFNIVHKFNYTPITKTTTWFSLSGIPITDKDGHVERYFGIVRDITDLMSAQQRLKEETLRAEDSGRLKSVFLANMTHEIRTPLNAIVGFSDLLQVVDSPEERREFIRIIRTNCDMLLRLINDILEASDMGQSIALKRESVDLALVFDDICQILQQRVENPAVEFLKDNPYSTMPAMIDTGRLQQVLTNFVTNAVKYTKQGHIRVGYRKESRNIDNERKDGICFYCEDTGEGIPKEKQASVFERFVKLNDFVQGTGLGLAICKAIIDKAGGRIGVNSEGEGKGSSFWFWIPV